MSDYSDGYDKGYEDGLDDNHRIDTWLMDLILGESDREEEWREGYEAGFEAGKGDREE
jgi:hypothetical protein